LKEIILICQCQHERLNQWWFVGQRSDQLSPVVTLAQALLQDRTLDLFLRVSMWKAVMKWLIFVCSNVGIVEDDTNDTLSIKDVHDDCPSVLYSKDIISNLNGGWIQKSIIGAFHLRECLTQSMLHKISKTENWICCQNGWKSEIGPTGIAMFHIRVEISSAGRVVMRVREREGKERWLGFFFVSRLLFRHTVLFMNSVQILFFSENYEDSGREGEERILNLGFLFWVFVEGIRIFSSDTKFDVLLKKKLKFVDWGRTNVGFIKIKEKIRIRASPSESLPHFMYCTQRFQKKKTQIKVNFSITHSLILK